MLGQLSNRVQHALRAFTPKDQKAVKVAAQTFRPNKKFDAAEVIQELGVGEALVSFLDAKGVPTPVERCFIAPPQSRIGPATDAERAAVIKASPLAAKYDRVVDRESAYEVLMGRATGGQAPVDEAAPPAPARRRGQYDAPPPMSPPTPTSGPWGSVPPSPAPPPEAPRERPRLREAQPPAPSPIPRTPAGSRADSIGTAIAKSAARTATTIAVREGSKILFGSGKNPGLLRGVLGSIFKG